MTFFHSGYLFRNVSLVVCREIFLAIKVGNALTALSLCGFEKESRGCSAAKCSTGDITGMKSVADAIEAFGH